MGPVFIGGLGRSGTTLVVDVVGCHPDVSPIYETGFVVALLKHLSVPAPYEQVCFEIRRLMEEWTRDLPRLPDEKRPYERYVHGPHYIRFDRRDALDRTEQLLDELPHDGLAAFRGFVSDLFARHASLDDKPHWVSKVPRYVQMLPLLRHVFPDMRFVHVVRDGRDVVASTLTRSWGANEAQDGAHAWVAGLQRAHEFARVCPDQMFEVRYEDVVSSPDATLGALFGWLGPTLPPHLVEEYRAAVGGLDASRIGQGRALSLRDRTTVETIADAGLRRYGYAEDAPAVGVG